MTPFVALLTGFLLGVAVILPDVLALKRARRDLRKQFEVLEHSSDFALSLAAKLAMKQRELDSLMVGRN